MTVTDADPNSLNSHENVVFDRSLKTCPKWLRERIISDLSKETRLLDIGCGAATLTTHLKKETGAEVIGVDVDRPSLVAGRSDNASDLLLGEGAHLPIADGAVDVIIAIESIEHIPDAKEFVIEARRVLSEGGVLWIKTPNRRAHDLFQLAKRNWSLNRHFHVSLFTPGELQNTLSEWAQSWVRPGLAEYQREKLAGIHPVIGWIADRVPFESLPLATQPSLVVRAERQ
ncbi:class I SAM-dependent methyltransferase [Salinirubrum litoreum]|uniref:Class I SAM-dependent methyltransferase n=1 Tax=Salinirubrum litoreum TaxID=1126234 RepID=A0ABD5RFG5_9EURY